MSTRLHPLGALVYVWVRDQDRASARRLVQAYAPRIARRFGLSDVDARVAATIAVAAIANPTCADCRGRGYGVIDGTTTLNDIKCTRCRGSGRESFRVSPAADWVYARLSEITERLER